MRRFHPDELVSGTVYTVEYSSSGGLRVCHTAPFLKMEAGRVDGKSVLWLWFKHRWGDTPIDYAPDMLIREYH